MATGMQLSECCRESLAKVELAPDTTDKMLSAEYWLCKAGAAGSILLDKSQIQSFNKRIAKHMASQGYIYNLDEFGDEIEGEDLISMILKYTIDGELLYFKGHQVAYMDWIKIKANRNLQEVEKRNTVRYGICIRRCNMRMYPTDNHMYSDPEDACTDALQNSAMLINEPVVVLHESKDGEWFFVRNYYYDGWVKKCDIALCTSYLSWKKQQHDRDYLVVTGNAVMVFGLPCCMCESCCSVSCRIFTMGTHLQLAEPEEYCKLGESKVDWRTVVDNYVVKIPGKNQRGLLSYELAMLPVSADVCSKELPYCTELLLKQVFKTLGDLYGWGGSFESRDCSSLVMEVYRCFGFRLPRNVSGLEQLTDCITYTGMEKWSIEEKKQLLNVLQPGALIGFPGHVMIYLGSENEQYYVINEVGSFYVDTLAQSADMDMGITRKKVNSCIVNSMDVKRKSGISWIASVTFVKVLI